MSWITSTDLSTDEQEAFAGPEAALAHLGELINDSRTNFTKKVKVSDKWYYVKRYFRSGKHVRRVLGTSRVKREWENAGWFAEHGIPCPRRIAFGEGNRRFGDYWGVIICEEVVGTLDLRRVYEDRPDLLQNRLWRRRAALRLAEVVSKMHGLGFVHNDLQWRNLLVRLDDDPEIYIIDCPAGRQIYLPASRRGVVRDLAFLDKMARDAVSSSDRLRFYLRYSRATRLDSQLKDEIRRILGFFRRKR